MALYCGYCRTYYNPADPNKIIRCDCPAAAAARIAALREQIDNAKASGDPQPVLVVPTNMLHEAAANVAQLDAIRAALAPVMHWYDGEPADGDEHEPRDLADILTDVVSDLQADRASSLRMLAALRPFAACMEYIKPEEDDEEWAKFRLLIKHYRAAQAAIDGVDVEERADV